MWDFITTPVENKNMIKKPIIFCYTTLLRISY